MGKSFEEQQNELAIAIAYALNAWTGVEEALLVLFGWLSGIPSHEKAQTIFNAVLSLPARLDICDALMADAEETDENKEIWNKLSAKIGTAYKQRHQIAHFKFITDFKKVSAEAVKEVAIIWPFWPTRSGISLSVVDVRDKQQRFERLDEAVSSFSARYAARQFPGFPTPEPSLIQELRDLVARNRAAPPTRRPPSPE